MRGGLVTAQCRVCGCTDEDACVDLAGQSCHWVEADLCSACVGEVESAPLVEIYTEGEANAAIAAMRRGAL
jgi:hypothetical protein